MNEKRVGTSLAFLFLLLSAATADTFRVGSLAMASIDASNPEAQTFDLGYIGALGIQFPKDPLFLKAIEIEIKVPQELIEYRNSIAYGLYSRPDPAPASGTRDYKANQITLQPLPSRLSFVLQVPLVKDHRLKSGPYSTVLPYVHDPKNGSLLFRLLPVMKALPDNIEGLSFQVKVKPILTDEGGFRLSLAYPAEGDAAASQGKISVRIDEMPVENPLELQILKPGSHHLSIVSDSYRNEVRVFNVEQGRVNEMTVSMEDTAPRLYLIAPENALILFDGERVGSGREARVVEPGDHVIKFTIGDYEIVKQVTIERAHDYTVSLVVDVNVTETP